ISPGKPVDEVLAVNVGAPREVTGHADVESAVSPARHHVDEEGCRHRTDSPCADAAALSSAVIPAKAGIQGQGNWCVGRRAGPPKSRLPYMVSRLRGNDVVDVGSRCRTLR